MAANRGIHRWVLHLLVIVLCSSTLVSPLPPSSVPSKPHIVFILADDLGWYDVSWHNPKAITPNLETLAKDGILLEQSYVQPICTPTRSALLTGRYPFTIGRQHGVLKSESPTGLLLNATLLPESLKEAGYSTHAVGKWHLGFCNWDYTPTHRGFDTFYGYYGGSEDHYNHSLASGRLHGNMFSAEDVSYGYDFRNNTEPDLSVNGTYDTYLFSSYVEDLLYSRNPDDPMFLYLALQSVHTPLEVPNTYREPFQYIGNEDREILLGMSWAMDDAVGTVVDALKETGHYENSIIIFSSDNGANPMSGNNWPLRGGKGSLWEGGTRAPGFIHSPLLPETGIISNTLLHVTDWYATLMGLAGGAAPEITDGFDQWEALTTGAESPRTSFIYNIDNQTIITTQVNAAIRKGEYKLIVGVPGEGSWTTPPEGIDSDPQRVHVSQRLHVSHDICIANDLEKQYQRDDLSSDFPKINLADDVKSLRLPELLLGDNTRIQLYNVIADPEEREDISDTYPDIVQGLLEDLEMELPRMVPADDPPNDPSGDPKYFDNVWSPGWC